MAAVAKKNVRRVIVDVIRQAFFRQNLRFHTKWYLPRRSRSVFCFRGDADGGPRRQPQKLAGHGASIRLGQFSLIFFCTSRYLHKKDLIRNAAADGLEVGSHNHWHIVFPDKMTNRISLARAEKVLSSACYMPRGFVAPAYFWQPTLYRSLEERGYHSSCFGINHDGIPYQPVVDGRIGEVTEVPFHCLGDRFPRFDIPLDSPTTRQFFANLIKKKHDAGEPMFLYGHPDIPGRMGTTPELVRFICETALGKSDVKGWQLSPYITWWRRRTSSRIECQFEITSHESPVLSIGSHPHRTT